MASTRRYSESIEGSPSRAGNPELEGQILADPSADAPFLVYADWLQSQGDVRGELAALQASAHGTEASIEALVWEHRAHLYGPLAAYVSRTPPRYGTPAVRATWRHGFMRALWLSATSGYEAGGVTVPAVDGVEALVEQLPAVDSARFLHELTLCCPVAEDEFRFHAAVDALSRVVPRLPALRRLTIGEFEVEESELSWSHLGPTAALWPACRALTHVKLHVGSMDLTGLSLPACQGFRVETGGLDQDSMACITGARWPALTHLTLWFGMEDYGGTCTVDDVSPILDTGVMPRLTHLGLANSTFGNELARALASSRRLPTLTSLDLSMSHLTTEGLQALAGAKERMGGLKVLNVSRCLLDEDGVALARTLAPTVHVEGQEDPEEYEAEDYRYAAVGE